MNGYADFLLDTDYLDKAIEEVKKEAKDMPQRRFWV